MFKLTAFSAIVAIVVFASPLPAQGSPQRLGIDLIAVHAQSSRVSDLLTGPEIPGRQAVVAAILDSLPTTKHTLRREGAIVGGVLFGGLGFLVSQMDDPDSGGHVSTVGFTLGGVALGALTGALIGNFITRSDSTEAAQRRP